MPNYPFKLRVKRRRQVVQLELMVPTSGSSWYVKERVELGELTLADALKELMEVDLTAQPGLKALLVPTIT